MKNKNRIRLYQIAALLFILSLLGLAACEKEVHIKLASSPTQLVVQGAIETGQPPYVLLTNSMGFFSSVNLSTPEGVFVHNAIVPISDGTKTVTLKEYGIDTGLSNKFYVYSLDTSLMLGENGKTYTLTINSENKIYTASAKIPFPKGPDSIWFDAPTFQTAKTPKNAQELFGSYTDPDTLGNFVRYFTSRNNDAFLAGGIFADDLVNGKKIGRFDILAGYNDSINVNIDSVLYFYAGDSVTVKWCEIDRGVFNFWNTYQFSVQSVGNPFSAPINAKGNISNGALGVWSGYGTLFRTIVAK